MTAQKSIPAGRLTLRPLRGSDAPAIARACSDVRVARMTSSIPHPYPPGAAEAFVAGRGAEDCWAMDGSAAGLPELCGVVGLTPDGDGAELGYWVAPDLWGRGLASAAVRALVRRNPLALPALHAGVYRDNPASARVLIGAGFVLQGEDEGFSVARGASVRRWRYRRSLP